MGRIGQNVDDAVRRSEYLELAMQVDAYALTADRLLVPIDAGGMSDEWFADDVIRWIRITSASAEEVERALRPLELHSRIVHACANPQPPQAEVLESVLFMAMPLWRPGAADMPPLRIAGTATTLITIQDGPIEFIERLTERLRGDQHLLGCSAAALTFHLIEAMLRSLIPVYLTLRADVEATADTLETTPHNVKADDLLALRRRAARLAHLLEDYLYCIVELEEARSESLHLAGVRERLHELAADVDRGQELIARMEERIRGLRQSSLSYQQEATNRRLNILAVLSAIYLPSTLIAGIYGMNFDNIPITKVPYGYFVVLVLMLGIVVGQIWFFYRRGWLK